MQTGATGASAGPGPRDHVHRISRESEEEKRHRLEQDAVPMDAETLLHPPRGYALSDRGDIQG